MSRAEALADFTAQLLAVLAERDAEIARLHEFTLAVAERLYAAAEVLSVKAEKKERRNA